MNLEPSSEQLALVEAVRSVCDDHFNSEALHHLTEDFQAGDYKKYEGGWNALAELGLFNLVTDEAKGGVGLGYVEAMLVFEELGRRIVPGPILETFMGAELLGEVKRVGFVDLENEPKSEDVLLLYNPGLLDGVIAIDKEGVWFIKLQAKDIALKGLPLDPLTPVGTIERKVLDEAEKQHLGDSTVAERLKSIGTLLTSAFQVGLADGALSLAVNYAKEREQFDAPIGSFQAVKHICADMLTQVEVARAALYSAGVMLDEPDENIATHISAARVTAIKAADFCAKSCVQVFGGMGYTWEADPHLYLKRAWVLQNSFGSLHFHSERLGDLLESTQL